MTETTIFPPRQFCQAAWVVADLFSAIEHWTQVARVGPFFINRDVKMSEARYRGTATSIPVRIGLAQAGPLQIELIEQLDDTPSAYRDSVPYGQNGFHHMAAFADDVDGEIARYVAAGSELAYDGYFGDVRIGYLDTRAHLGFMIELFNHRPAMDHAFAQIAKAAGSWDGTRPIRELAELGDSESA